MVCYGISGVVNDRGSDTPSSIITTALVRKVLSSLAKKGNSPVLYSLKLCNQNAYLSGEHEHRLQLAIKVIKTIVSTCNL